ncbi:MAG: hypothetical protein U0172_05095 [Nitrospiraceae bacterium]
MSMQEREQAEQQRIAMNLQRAIELTTAALLLREAVVAQTHPAEDPMVVVMREIRHAKEQAWQRRHSS